MSPLQQGESVEVSGYSETWSLDSGALLVHNAHVQSEIALDVEQGSQSGNCRICQGDLEAVATRITPEESTKVSGDAVVEGTGADEAETAPSPRVDASTPTPWWDR